MTANEVCEPSIDKHNARQWRMFVYFLMMECNGCFGTIRLWWNTKVEIHMMSTVLSATIAVTAAVSWTYSHIFGDVDAEWLPVVQVFGQAIFSLKQNGRANSNRCWLESVNFPQLFQSTDAELMSYICVHRASHILYISRSEFNFISCKTHHGISFHLFYKRIMD